MEKATLQNRVSSLNFHAASGLCSTDASFQLPVLPEGLLLPSSTVIVLQVTALEMENRQLISNISQIYKTAQQELHWKENEIGQLRDQLSHQARPIATSWRH